MVASSDTFWIGFDLGGTKMNAVLLDQNMQVVGRRRKKTRGHEGAEAGVERMCSTIEKLLEEGGVTASQLRGIGVGAPGPIDMNSGVILEAPNLGWIRLPLKERLQRRFGCEVAVCNDVDAGVYGEYRYGATNHVRSLLGVFPGTGIGAGLVYEGRIYRGTRASCLELGHIPVVPDGAPCGCGRTGCLETVASRLSMSAEIAKAAYRGQAPHLLRVAGTDLANIRSGALAEAIMAGDQLVETIVRKGAKYLGVAIAGVANLLLPDVIVLGGGLVEALPELFVEEVSNALNRHVMPAYVGQSVVRVAELGDDAGVRGAAAWVEHVTQSGEGAAPALQSA
jgi:glucokinase